MADWTQLAQQLRTQAPASDWNIGGIDRADELAQMLYGRGVRDLSQMRLTQRDYTRPMDIYGRDPSQGWDSQGDSYTAHGYGLDFGDGLTLGDLGDQGKGGRYTDQGVLNYLDRQYDPTDPTRGLELGWNSQGHGNVSYRVMQGADGRPQIVPQWGSSSDAGDARDIAKMAAAIYGGGSLAGATAGGAGAGAASGAQEAFRAAELASYGGSGGASALGTTGAGLSVSLTPAEIEAANLAATQGVGSSVTATMPGITATEAAAGGTLGSSGVNAMRAGEIASYGTSGAMPSSAATVAGGGGMWDTVANWAGNNWQNIAGSVLGAATSRDQQQTASRDPWGPAQPLLKDLIAQGQQLNQQYQQQPFNPLQQQWMNRKAGLLDALTTQQLPGLLSGLSAMNQGYQRPGGPAARQSAMNYSPAGLLNAMGAQNIDWNTATPYRRG